MLLYSPFIYSIAKISNNENVCELVPVEDGLYDAVTSFFYLYGSHNPKITFDHGDVDLDKTSCVIYFAQLKKDDSICSALTNSGNKWRYDSCINVVARTLANPSYCQKHFSNGSLAWDNCIGDIAWSLKRDGEVYTCGRYIKIVNFLLGGGSTFYGVDGEKINCPLVGPDFVSEECKQLGKLECQKTFSVWN